MKKLVIISGISGAGKTTASNIQEDKGYRCIDQYPPELLNELMDLIEHDESFKYQNVALTISLSDQEKYRKLFNNADLKPVLILIDADKETVINRYKFTRRVHPLLISNVADSLSEAIDIEKGILTPESAMELIEELYIRGQVMWSGISIFLKICHSLL